MPTFTELPSGKWRVQVRRKGGFYKNATFASKREARDWAATIESQAAHIVAGGFAPVPRGATLADLIDKYIETTKDGGRTKAASLERLRREIGKAQLTALSAVTLRDFIERRIKEGAGGVTISGDLSFGNAVWSWARHARRFDLPENLWLDARRSLKHRRLSTRSKERDREPTPGELERLYAYWTSKPRQRIDMTTLCRFALASGMRLGEICRLEVDHVDRGARTVLIRDRKDPRNKVGNDETVPLLPDAWAIVEPRLEGRAREWLFGGVRAASVSTAFTRACADLGIKDLHFHDLRHAAASSFFRMGLGIPQVAVMTGHRTWSMLRRYTNVRPADVHEAVARREREQANLVPMKRTRAARSAV